jgi:hypothetical protein
MLFVLDNTLSRRDWMTRFFQSSGALALTPFVCSSVEGAAVDGAENWTPQFFTPEQNANLTALGERIIPGSGAALCNRLIDLVMTVEDASTRQGLTEAIAAFGSFAGLPPQEQDRLLLEASAEHDTLRPQFVLVKEWVADTYWTSKQGLRELGWHGRVAWANFDACQHK